MKFYVDSGANYLYMETGDSLFRYTLPKSPKNLPVNISKHLIVFADKNFLDSAVKVPNTEDMKNTLHYVQTVTLRLR